MRSVWEVTKTEGQNKEKCGRTGISDRRNSMIKAKLKKSNNHLGLNGHLLKMVYNR